jgi:hypothetical protein
MEKNLKHSEQKLTGMHPGIHGNVDGIRGNVTGIYGDVDGIYGDVDDCKITEEDRTAGINIRDLVAE